MSEKAVVIEAPGGPEQLKLVDVEVGAPGPGELRIRHVACGLNYIDVYHRNGAYPLPLPAQNSGGSVNSRARRGVSFTGDSAAGKGLAR